MTRIDTYIHHSSEPLSQKPRSSQLNHCIYLPVTTEFLPNLGPLSARGLGPDRLDIQDLLRQKTRDDRIGKGEPFKAVMFWLFAGFIQGKTFF